MHKLFVLFLIFLSVLKINAQTIPKDYVNVPGPILFDKMSYGFVWSSHLTDNNYIQEYIRNGDNLDSFKTLITLDVLISNINLRDAALAKIAELKKLHEKNPVVQYQVYERKNEVMIDFLMSENTPDDKFVHIIERNVYRYTSVKDSNGKVCILLFALSERAYDDDITPFFAKLKKDRNDLLNQVGTYKLPEITILN